MDRYLFFKTAQIWISCPKIPATAGYLPEVIFLLQQKLKTNDDYILLYIKSFTG